MTLPCEYNMPLSKANLQMGELLGEGAFGQVFKATDRTTGQVYALKSAILNSHEESNLDESSQREIRFMSRLKGNINILSLHCLFADRERGSLRRVFLCLEFCCGDLKSILDNQSIQLSRAEKLNCLQQIVSGVNHIHQHGIIHRDLKPSNILVAQGGVVKIADFGVAIDVGEYNTRFEGDVYYCSPEQHLGKRRYGTEVDMWAIGVTLLYLWFRHYPFETNHRLNIIKEIIGYCGRIEPSWPQVVRFKRYHSIKHVTYKKGIEKAFLFDGHGLDLARLFLHYNPNKRISSREAMHHNLIWRQIG